MNLLPTTPSELHLEALHRYPVKGLSPERLDAATLRAGAYFPGDRLFAIENGPSGFDPAAPKHQPKIKFLMLMRNEGLARLATRYDADSSILTISQDGRCAVEADVSVPEGREAVEAFFAREFADALRGPPKLLTAPEGFRFTDSARGFVSLLNLASVAATEDMVGAPVDPLRFRANLHLSGLAPFAELDLVGRVLGSKGGVRLQVSKRTERCAATNVDPATGLRDLAIPKALSTQLGHTDCGVYAEVLSGGRLEQGETLLLEPCEVRP
ncbi:MULTISPECIES: MOSC N-terminal beta barrel domain-containing protein [unclassified Methylobacterium]|uniref:MOSC domain-containing protein n=1 Tax=unclassified Methylobacterium TaxID=2615210 RepID=UPI0006F7E845|nr:MULTISPECIES: MOSC N-terminal beta barrel domain-containing protein [unclassified Methylobacterium]KQO60535.1 molybdenum cofactor sulfurase [Methylobacterium sp. Leaf86]KQO86334.1 molybdenum cofactor sulfurase [Methylobacterium sp. Leaf91]